MRARPSIGFVAAVASLLAVLAWVLWPAPRPATVRWEGLDVHTFGAGSSVFVYLHGYGEELDAAVGVARHFAARYPARYWVPEGPVAAERGGRAWFEWEVHAGGLVPIAAQQEATRRALVALLGRARAEVGPTGRVIVAGMSEGGRNAVDAALAADVRPDAVLCFSGGWIDTWRMDRARGLRLFWSHGRRDPIFAIQDVQWAARALEAGGASIELAIFEGGHELSPSIEPALAYLGRLP